MISVNKITKTSLKVILMNLKKKIKIVFLIFS